MAGSSNGKGVVMDISSSDPIPATEHRTDGADGDNTVADWASEWSRRRSGAAGHQVSRRSRRWSRRSLDPRRRDNYSGGRQRQRGGRSNQHRHTVSRRQHLQTVDRHDGVATRRRGTCRPRRHAVDLPTRHRVTNVEPLCNHLEQTLTGTASDHETRRKPSPRWSLKRIGEAI